MVRGNGIFGAGTNLSSRLITDFQKLSTQVEACRAFGYRIVLTSGTFDLAHPGHARYLEEARTHGDILVVGVDSDEKTRARKGDDRPLIPQDERIEMLAHLRHVDLIFLKELNHPHWELIRCVQPDVLIVSSSTKPYSDAELAQLKALCGDGRGEVIVLPPQATTSASARIRRFQIGIAQKIAADLAKAMPPVIDEVVARYTGGQK